MDSTRDLEIANLEALISLRQAEEKRLQAIIGYDNTSPEIRSQASAALSKLLKDIQEDVAQVYKLKAGL
jgi:hypothetical protein